MQKFSLLANESASGKCEAARISRSKRGGGVSEGALAEDLTMCNVAARILEGSFHALSLAKNYVVVRRSE